MKKTLILSAILLLTSATVFAQKNSPVAGQASILSDLLKKDYSSIDPEQKGDELIKDRTLAISIFKSFLSGKTPAKPYDQAKLTALNAAINLADTDYTVYQKNKRNLSAPTVTSVSTSNDAVVSKANSAAIDRGNTYDTARSAYYAAKYKADVAQLQYIQYLFRQDNNFFISRVMDLFITKYLALGQKQVDNQATVNNNSTVQKALPFIGGDLDFSTVIDGLSKFLAKRIKEELTTFAVQNIQAWIQKNKTQVPLEQLLVLLPTTANYIAKFDADKITSFPNEIKQYIEYDLNHLLENSYGLKKTTYFKRLIEQNPDLELAFEALHLVPDLAKVKYPGDYFTILNSSQLINNMRSTPNNVARYNIAASMGFLEMLSNSLTITDNGEPKYTTVDFWSNYGRDPVYIKTFIGFLYQQNLKYYNVQFEISANSYFVLQPQLDLLMKADSTCETIAGKLQPVISDICKNSQQIYTQAQAIKKLNSNGQHVGADTVYTFVKSIIDFTRDMGSDADQVIDLFTQQGHKPLSISAKIKPYLTLAGAGNEAIKSIRGKKYAQGILLVLDSAYQVISASGSQNTIAFESLYKLTQLSNAAWPYWASLTQLQNNPGNLSADLSQAATKLSLEVAAIKNFYLNMAASPSRPVADSLDRVSQILSQMATGGNLSQAQVTSLKNFTTDQRYVKITVSYYASFEIDDLSKQLAAKMVGLVLYDTSHNPYHPFKQEDADRLTTMMDTYVQEVFRTNILQTDPGNTDLRTNQQDLIRALIQLFESDVQTLFGSKLNPKTVSLIHFVNDMALAQTSDDVEQAIEALALPAGSYSVQQSSAYTVSLSSYPGILFGKEITATHSPVWSTGFTAPVGLSVTRGSNKGGWSFAAFIPIIDVGAFTRLRLDDSSTQALPNITFKNVFSPGLYICFGIPQSPFSLNVGGQYGPEVQDVNSGPTHNSWRAGIGLTINIPLFNIYTRPFKDK